jgi:hypothetical protein
MTASIVSSTLGVTATSWGTLDVDYPRTLFAYLEWIRSEVMRVKEIRILTEDVVALIFANIGKPTEWKRQYKILVIEEGDIHITVNSIVVSDPSSKVDKAGGGLA